MRLPIAIGLFLAVFACTGLRAINDALYPTLIAAWPDIREEAEAGGADSMVLNGFESLLQRRVRDPESLVVWQEIREHAEAGINLWVEEGIISFGVAKVLRDRLVTFEEGYRNAVVGPNS